ncbi:unnamed protein product [Phytophthora fragariaefolia]|uniref:Unnamed protein product n=1 Tax=Phytophthora fragariaefolia TaxID=1490495 RepID=A0A9W6XS81_9STRA|nr:unnamed protein product [Phytophthora fragariaefolia]
MVLRCSGLLALAALGLVITSGDSSTSVDLTTFPVGVGTSTESADSSGGGAAAGDDAALPTVGHILHFSDVHLNISATLDANDSAAIPVAYGDDAPTNLLVSALEYAKRLLPEPDFFLYTGDHVVHGDLTDEYLAAAVEENVEIMAKYFAATDNGTTLDITAIIGNSDTSPDYTMNVTDPETEENPNIALISAAWKDTMSPSNLDWFNRRGYLAYALDVNVIVITLNTLPYSVGRQKSVNLRS